MTVLIDTGPIVALLDRRDAAHAWARDVLAACPTPLFTCEAVIAEASHILRRHGSHLPVELGERGFLRADFALSEEWSSVRDLMRKYADVPMSLADACLVRMVELTPDARLVTLDSDFSVYRKNGRQVIRTITPAKRR